MKFGKRKSKPLAVTGIEAAPKPAPPLPEGEMEYVCAKTFSAHKDFKPGDIVRCTPEQFVKWTYHGYVREK